MCDKFTTFADKLSIPTSLLCVHGGLIVHQAPHTLFLKDTDGDGKADVRQVLFTGWGTGDTHAGPSNLRYGLDNWIYGMCGYSGFSGTVGRRDSVKFGQGLASASRRRRRTASTSCKVTKLEFLRSTNNNSWGVGFNEEGVLFGCTANGCPLVHLPIPNRYYEKVRGLTAGVLPNIALDNHVEPIIEGRPPGRLARRLHRRRRARDLHRPHLPAGILEPHRVRLRADRPPDGRVRAATERHRLRRPLRLEPRRQPTTTGPPRSSPRSARTGTCG